MNIWNGLTQTKIGRFFSLFLLALIGTILISKNWIFQCQGDAVLECLIVFFDLENDISISSLRGLLLGLPVFIGLWYFRTHDTKEQIQKTQEQIEKTQVNINVSLLVNGYNLLAHEKTQSRCIGLKTLVAFGNEHPNYKKEIYANLRGVDFSKGNLVDAELQGANLNGANLHGANLNGANLNGANLQEAILDRANLFRANLQKAYLEGANLQKANLEGAYLEGANLQKANLEGASLQEANLQEAILQGTKLFGAYLEGAELTGAHYDKYTIFPADFDPKAHNMIEVDENGKPINEE